MIVRLFILAHGRSGDKGDAANVGVIARRQEWYEFIKMELTAERVAEFLRPLAEGPVERYELDNLGALNFVVHRALGGGGSVSLRLDAQGKTYAQAVLRMPLRITGKLETQLRAFWGKSLPSDCVLSDAKTVQTRATPTKKAAPRAKKAPSKRVRTAKKSGTAKKKQAKKSKPAKKRK